jgi:hypothetical protein
VYGVEQAGQRSSSFDPHSMQNFADGGFCAPQWPHAVIQGL